ncbi:hypothetical protein TGVAND_436080 [Toxoplasma gondii VAND]|uniref:Uncharacterized protein n=1 Tax=Toxoplasma gondii VAND TaxID=933077 RepID=A0A086QA16_TOXGO|nr:hypothetical protein TGVAND_436080 [Toxoplasma gondii VAND]
MLAACGAFAFRVHLVHRGQRRWEQTLPFSTSNRIDGEDAETKNKREDKREDTIEDVPSQHSGHESRRNAHPRSPTTGAFISGASSFTCTLRASGRCTPSERNDALAKDAEAELLLLLQTLQTLEWSLTDRERPKWARGGVVWRCAVSVFLNTPRDQSSNLLPVLINTEISKLRSLVTEGRMCAAAVQEETPAAADPTLLTSATTVVCSKPYGQLRTSSSALKGPDHSPTLSSTSSTTQNLSKRSSSRPPSVTSLAASQGHQKTAAASAL